MEVCQGLQASSTLRLTPNRLGEVEHLQVPVFRVRHSL